ncbi:MAG: hypothetical protein AVO35_08835 [Candidatus Aegiribacteria sp. MLS_C]|nr:MAG: hypothetical protein AVO35_08835 [Candidatus Aegiribacteria sp. MLS_C]
MSESTVYLSIGGLVFSITGPSRYMGALNEGRYRDFHRSAAEADLALNVHDSPRELEELLPPSSRKVFDSNTVWSLWEGGGGIHMLLRSPVMGGTPYRLASFDEGLTTGDVWTIAGRGGHSLLEGERDPLEFPLSEVLMVLLLSRGLGLMVHACGLESGGRGLLFPGNSTHGKSTMASLWRDRARILNDDRIILREREGAIAMYGTPWHGDMSDVSAEGVPLTAVSFLFHGRKNVLAPVSGARAVSMLLRRSFLPVWSREGMEFSLRFCEETEERVAFGELRFVPDKGVVDFLECRI